VDVAGPVQFQHQAPGRHVARLSCTDSRNVVESSKTKFLEQKFSVFDRQPDTAHFPLNGPSILHRPDQQLPARTSGNSLWQKFFRNFLNCGLMALSGHARNLSHCCGKTPPQLCLDAIQFGFALGIFVLSANLPFNLCASHTRVRLSTPGCDQTLC